MYDTSITDSQFRKLSDIVYRTSGINLSSNKINLLKARLAKRLRSTKTSNVSDYIRLIENDNDEFRMFIDGITTNHTYFFRENRHCEFLVETMNRSEHLRIWSAASSSGEEAYSIAIQLMESSFNFSIFASDISDTILDTAKRGVYPIERTRAVPEHLLRRYFQKGINSSEGYVRVRDNVKNHVTFGKYNLVTETPPSSEYHIIFCRNVMIYFDLITKQKVMDNMIKALKQGGFFIFGQSESMVGIKTSLTTVSPSIYRKN